MAKKKEPVQSVYDDPDMPLTLDNFESRLEEVLLRKEDSEIFQDYMFRFMADFCDLIADLNGSVNMGTEVHVSRDGRRWTIQHLARAISRNSRNYYKGYWGKS